MANYIRLCMREIQLQNIHSDFTLVDVVYLPRWNVQSNPNQLEIEVRRFFDAYSWPGWKLTARSNQI